MYCYLKIFIKLFCLNYWNIFILWLANVTANIKLFQSRGQDDSGFVDCMTFELIAVLYIESVDKLKGFLLINYSNYNIHLISYKWHFYSHVEVLMKQKCIDPDFSKFAVFSCCSQLKQNWCFWFFCALPKTLSSFSQRPISVDVTFYKD